MLLEVEKEGTGAVNKAWVFQKDMMMAEESEVLWLTLKYLTEDNSEPRKVVTSVMHEDGFAAWSRLNARYGLALAARQGQVLAQFASMVKVSKTPAETRSNMTEIDRMAKIVFEVTGRPVTDESMKGVLVGSLDPITRQMTAHLHGVDTSTEELRNHISRFTSNGD